MVVQFRNLTYKYPAGKKNVLHNINLEIHKGEFVAVIGENGSGKTTLCKCINGIIPHSERGSLKGQVLIQGRNTLEIPTAALAQQVGIVLEDPETQLFTTSVANEAAFGPENLNMPPDEIRKRVTWALKIVRLEGYEEHSPAALSSGQKQRLAIAATLTMRPEILVLDEPTSQLDPLGTEEVFAVIENLKEQYGMTIVMASHKMEEIMRFTDKVCVLHKGRILGFAPPRSIFKDKEIFEQRNLAMPYTFKLANALAEKNIRMAECLTEQEAKQEIQRLLAVGKGKK